MTGFLFKIFNVEDSWELNIENGENAFIYAQFMQECVAQGY